MTASSSANQPLADSNSIEAFDLFLNQFEKTTKRNHFQLEYLAQLSRELNEAEIPIIPLKGASLLIRAYPSAGMRSMADMDLLIQSKDIRKVMAFFEKKGLIREPDEGLTYVNADRSINLDIIWDFWYFINSKETAGIWKNSIRHPFRGAPIQLLHPEDEFIYLTAYTAAHRGVLSSTFVRDLNVFLEKESRLIDWTRIAQKIQSLKLETFLFHGLSYAIQNGLSKLPEDFLLELTPKSPGRKILFSFLKRLVTEAPQPKVSYFFTWLGYPRFQGKLRLLREKLAPSPLELEIHRGISSKTGYWAWIFLHPWVIAAKTAYHAFCRLFQIKTS